MYCRKCYYDLRGQTVPRCPECGLAFVPGDATTYSEVIPSRWRTLAHRLRRILLVPTTALLVLLLIGSAPSRSRAIAYSVVSMANLKHITTVWMVESLRGPLTEFKSPVTLRDKLEPRLSARTQRRIVRQKLDLTSWIKGTGRRYCLVLLIWGAVVAVIARGRARRVAIGFMFLASIALVSTFFADPLARWRYPGNYDYLQDFTFVDGWRWTDPARSSDGIAAYGSASWWNQRRNIAFGDGHVGPLPEEQFRCMAMEQGIEIKK
jgi:prepilin-type processing-associated H-X9-DG protein